MLTVLKNLPKDCAYDNVDSPVGCLSLLATSKALIAVLWESDRRDSSCERVLQKLERAPNHPVLSKARKQLTEYFRGDRQSFELPLSFVGTPFQVRAWKELARIPYGQTISYQEQARRIGDRKKARAVGAANGKNPISIIVPCHRVIAKDGDLAGFACGVENKKYLLGLEAQNLRPHRA